MVSALIKHTKALFDITSSRESGSPRSVHNGLGGLSIHFRNGRWQEWQQGAGITSGGNDRGRDGERRASRPEGETTTARRRDGTTALPGAHITLH